MYVVQLAECCEAFHSCLIGLLGGCGETCLEVAMKRLRQLWDVHSDCGSRSASRSRCDTGAGSALVVGTLSKKEVRLSRDKSSAR